MKVIVKYTSKYLQLCSTRTVQASQYTSKKKVKGEKPRVTAGCSKNPPERSTLKQQDFPIVALWVSAVVETLKGKSTNFTNQSYS